MSFLCLVFLSFISLYIIKGESDCAHFSLDFASDSVILRRHLRFDRQQPCLFHLKVKNSVEGLLWSSVAGTVSLAVVSSLVLMLELQRVRCHSLEVLLTGEHLLTAELLNVFHDMWHVENERLDLARLRLLVNILYEVALALDTAEGDFADFLGVERLP